MSKIEFKNLSDAELENVTGGTKSSLGGNALAIILEPGEDPATVLASFRLAGGLVFDYESIVLLNGKIAAEMKEGGYRCVFAEVSFDRLIVHIDSYTLMYEP